MTIMAIVADVNFPWYLIQIHNNGQIFDLIGMTEFKIGRSADAQIVCTNCAASRNHATIYYRNGDVYIKDKGSVNGTYVNKQKNGLEEIKLNHMDLIGIGLPEFFSEEHKMLFFRVYNKFKDPNPTIELTDSEDEQYSNSNTQASSSKAEQMSTSSANDNPIPTKIAVDCHPGFNNNRVEFDTVIESTINNAELTFDSPSESGVNRDCIISKESAPVEKATTNNLNLKQSDCNLSYKSLTFNENDHFAHDIKKELIENVNPCDSTAAPEVNSAERENNLASQNVEMKEYCLIPEQSFAVGKPIADVPNLKQTDLNLSYERHIVNQEDSLAHAIKVELIENASQSNISARSEVNITEEENKMDIASSSTSTPNGAKENNVHLFKMPKPIKEEVTLCKEEQILDETEEETLGETEEQMLQEEFEELEKMIQLERKENLLIRSKSPEETKAKVSENGTLNNSVPEGFPSSQFFDEATATTRAGTPEDPPENIFSWIKQELEISDYIHERQVYLGDSDSDDGQISINGLTRIFCSGESSTNNLQSLADQQKNGGKTEPSIFTNYLPSTSGIQNQASPKENVQADIAEKAVQTAVVEKWCASPLEDSNGVKPFYGISKKQYLKPPIIEAPTLRANRRQRLSVDSDKEAPPVKKKKKEPVVHLITLKKKGRDAKSNLNDKNTSQDAKKHIAEVRKQKLKALAQQAEKPPERLMEKCTNQAKENLNKNGSNGTIKDKAQRAKVKISEGRGAFLVEDAAKSIKKNQSSNVQSGTLSLFPRTANGVKSHSQQIQWKAADKQFIEIVLKWLPTWLEHDVEEILDDLLTCSGFKKPEKMMNRFNNCAEYYDVLVPLLVLDLWSMIYNEFHSKVVNKRKGVMVINIDEEDRQDEHVYLHCRSLLDENQNRNGIHPKNGDLIIIELITDDNEYPKLFGYIEQVYKRKSHPDDKYNTSVGYHHSGTITTKITFVIKTIKYPNKLLLERYMRIRIITYFSPILRIFNSVMCLQKSVLSKFILSPNPDDYIITETVKNSLVAVPGLELNPVQKQCVLEATHICSRPKPGIYMIQGPPGTGKTQVIVNIVLHVLLSSKKKQAILLVAPSNGAIDEIVLRLLQLRKKLPGVKSLPELKLVRVGVPDSIHRDVYPVSLSELARKQVKRSYQCEISEGAKKEIEFRKEKINALHMQKTELQKAGKDCSAILRKIQKENDDLNVFARPIDAMGREGSLQELFKAEEVILENANIIATTLTSCVSQSMEKYYKKNPSKISCCIVDEATQSNEPQTLMPLMLGIEKLVLIGDPQQLPATVLSQHAKLLGYGKSLFSRIMYSMDHLPNNPLKFLNIQYRMHSEICEFPNHCFYGDRLENGFNCRLKECAIKPYLVFNLQYRENPDDQYCNDLEVHFVVKLVEEVTKLCAAKNKYSIGIITPYVQQKDRIMQKLSKVSKLCHVDVNTVDSFQGQERDIIVLSCVRRTPNNFLSDEQRLNVALTRARRALYVCADHKLLRNCPILSQIFSNAQKRRKLISVTEKHFADEKFLEKCIKKT